MTQRHHPARTETSRKRTGKFSTIIVGFCAGCAVAASVFVFYPEISAILHKKAAENLPLIQVAQSVKEDSISTSKKENEPIAQEIPSVTGGEVAEIKIAEAPSEDSNSADKDKEAGEARGNKSQPIEVRGARLLAFVNEIGTREYFTKMGGNETSLANFSSLLQRVNDNPPIVLRESDDLLSLLKNIAHFFRIAGRTSTEMLAELLKEENANLEGIAADAYALLLEKNELEKLFSVHINDQTAYTYACYFLNSFGGRMYLFRRLPNQRLLATYYSLLIVDMASQKNENSNGVDIRQALDMLILEMEKSGDLLKNREEYLASLTEMKKRYSNTQSDSKITLPDNTQSTEHSQ